MTDYSLEGAKWSTDTITWSFANSTYGSDTSDPFSSAIASQYQSAIEQALQQWSAVTPLTFTQVPDSATQANAAPLRRHARLIIIARRARLGFHVRTFLERKGAARFLISANSIACWTMAQPLKIVIIGAGLGGLACAIASRRQGLEVVVLEKVGKLCIAIC